jgi:hypothetical protein
MNTKTTNKKQTSCVYSNHDLFSSVKERINAGNTGATIIVPHVCNNIDLFGAGFASDVATNYPIVKENYHLLGKNFLKANLGYSQFVQVSENKTYKHKLYIVNMIAQNGIKSHNNTRPLNYFALAKSMSKISQHITMNTGFLNKTEKVEIHCPKFGSGLAGGDWDFITDLIEDIWGKFFVTVYNYPPKK